jgi:hypothetical protein
MPLLGGSSFLFNSRSLVLLYVAAERGLVDLHLVAGGVNGDIDDFGFGDFDPFACAAVAFGFDDDVDGDRSCADAHSPSVEADEVADEDGLVEDDFAHGDGDEAFQACAAVGFDRAGDVYVAENDAAEDRALRVGVAGQERDADGGVAVRVLFGHKLAGSMDVRACLCQAPQPP